MLIWQIQNTLDIEFDLMHAETFNSHGLLTKVIIFGTKMSSSMYADNSKKDI